MPIPFFKPKAAPPAVFGGESLPDKQAGIFSRVFFIWIAPALKVGNSRPLEANDIWDLDLEVRSKSVGDRLQDNYQSRLPPSMRTAGYRSVGPPTSSDHKILFTPQPSIEDLNERAGQMEILANYPDQPGNNSDSLQLTAQLTRASTLFSRNEDAAVHPTKNHKSPSSHPTHAELVIRFGKRNAKKIQAGRSAVEGDTVYDMSLWKAMYRTGQVAFWKVIALLFASYMLRIAIPLVAKVLIDEFTRAKAYKNADNLGQSLDGLAVPKSLGLSFGLIAVLFVMLGMSTVFLTHAQRGWAILGLGTRGAIIDLISRKSMRLSGRSREEFTPGRINTMVTADTSYCEWIWADAVTFVALIPQIVVGSGLLLWQLGYSALVALAILALSGPVQVFVYKRLMKKMLERQKLVDQRVRILTEVINHIREVKLYAYESLFGRRVEEKRNAEMTALRSITVLNSVSASLMFFIPTLAAIAAFIVYSATGHQLDAGKIFLSLQLLNVLRQPISWLPKIIAAYVNFLVAAKRIGEMLQAEEDVADLIIHPGMTLAVSMKGDFQYERAYKKDDETKPISTAVKIGAKLSVLKEKLKSPMSTPNPSHHSLPLAEEDEGSETIIKEPFILKDIDLEIPRGALVCVVGRVGSGKSALLQSMINEVKAVTGEVSFCGPISYVPQHAWVQSGTIRDNITFATEAAEANLERVAEVTRACGLTTDLASLPAGDQTYIGERGITLSGGQRQRICIARAAYQDTDVVLLDDPFSAVDAQVGHHILHHCILSGPLAHRTRILVTHHLDVLPLADIVIMLQGDSQEGRIVQQGSYQDLMEVDGPFRTLIQEYGSKTSKEKPEEVTEKLDKEAKPDESKEGEKLHLDEDRETGSIALSTYLLYLDNMGHWSFVLILVFIFVLAQISSVVNILWLGWWGANRFPNVSTGAYMAGYAGIGLVFAIALFLSTYILAVLGLQASFAMFRKAWESVMRSPTTWHDRTPTGRIISRLSRDVDMMDYRLPAIIWLFVTNALIMVGTFGLVVYTYPWLGLTFIPILVFIYFTFSFYQRSSRELKRVDSLQRSFVYGNLAEQLSGLAVIKAFGKQGRFESLLQKSVDEMGKMYAARWFIQCWLNMRIAAAGGILVVVVALFGVATRDQSDPYKFGVVLTYVMIAAFVLQDLIPNLAQTEQEMNNVERVGKYTLLEHEAAPLKSTDPTESQWPTDGTIAFEDVQLRYRPDLPLVLKGLTFEIKPGEKVGIIGRTGAGKSSLVQALYRTVELSSGRIMVDGQDLASLGLETLRSRLSIIPQESFLFAGSVREIIDPAGLKPDHELNETLSLIHDNPSASSSLRDKFRLETEVQHEGSNFSAGERQLLALMRALVRGCKILVLDEATSSVDPETDALIQRIIQAEFSHVTLISIAHRLQTVAYYDRILVMDAGIVAEFDSPLVLFDTPGSIFRSLCDTKQLSREDLVRIQTDAATPSV